MATDTSTDDIKRAVPRQWGQYASGSQRVLPSDIQGLDPEVCDGRMTRAWTWVVVGLMASSARRGSGAQDRFRLAVLQAAEWQCRWIEDGRRCEQRSNLEAHHLVLFRDSGSTDPRQ